MQAISTTVELMGVRFVVLKIRFVKILSDSLKFFIIKIKNLIIKGKQDDRYRETKTTNRKSTYATRT